MELLPETTLGNFFNHQTRTTATYQLIETLSGSRNGTGGLHLFKAGLDLLRSRFSRDERQPPGPDPALRRHARAAARFRPADAAIDRQHRRGACSRRIACSRTRAGIVEFGGRLDRDGVIRRFNVTPRVGTAVLLNESGSAVLRGGFGLFYERTPSAAGAFSQYESFVDTRFGARRRHAARRRRCRFAHTTAPDLADVAQPRPGTSPTTTGSMPCWAAARRRRSIGAGRTS